MLNVVLVSVVMLSVSMLNVVLVSVIMLIVVMLSGVSPLSEALNLIHSKGWPLALPANIRLVDNFWYNSIH
jgi:hypothetical protein